MQKFGWLESELNFQLSQTELQKGKIVFFTEVQSTGITNTGQLLEYSESWDNKESRHPLDSLLLSFLPRDLWMCGMTPPPAIVVLMRESNSFLKNLFILLIYFCGCVGSSLLRVGFL